MKIYKMDEILMTEPPKPPKIVFYGPEGIGKTGFGTQLPKPIFLRAEDGMGEYRGVARFPGIAKEIEDVRGAIRFLANETHDFESFVIDSIDWLEPIIWADWCEENNFDNIESPGYQRGYKEVVAKWTALLSSLNKLNDMGMTICLLGHAVIEKFQSPGCEPYDRYHPATHKKATAKIFEWADMCLFAHTKVLVKKEDAGFGKTNTYGAGVGNRVILTTEGAVCRAKNRYSLPHEIPFKKTGMWEDLSALIEKNRAEQKTDKD